MQKLYYSISEVAKAVDEEQHILRYWEKQFDLIKPRKNRAGNRVYSERDLNIIKAIKKFIREDKLSLSGTKERLSTYTFGNDVPSQNEIFEIHQEIAEIESDKLSISNFDTEYLIEIKELLLDIRNFLDK